MDPTQGVREIPESTVTVRLLVRKSGTEMVWGRTQNMV